MSYWNTSMAVKDAPYRFPYPSQEAPAAMHPLQTPLPEALLNHLSLWPAMAEYGVSKIVRVALQCQMYFVVLMISLS